MLASIDDHRALPTDVAVRFIPVVRRMAAHLARRLPSHVRIEDLTSAGLLGLVTAYHNFDAARGEDFFGYAERRIHGAMLDELRAVDPLSRHARALKRRVDQAKHGLEGQRGRAPLEGEIAAELGMTLADYQALRTRLGVGVTVSSADLDSDDAPRELPDQHVVPADEQLAHEEATARLRDAIARLPPRLRRVVISYYAEGRTLSDIGAELGVTESRVCQLRAVAVKRLRSACAEPLPLAA